MPQRTTLFLSYAPHTAGKLNLLESCGVKAVKNVLNKLLTLSNKIILVVE
jgi:hypothetical protein